MGTEKRDSNSKGTIELYNHKGERARVDAGSEAEASFLDLGYAEKASEKAASKASKPVAKKK